MEESSKLALPDAFLDFLKVNGLDPSIYTASDSTPRYIRLKPGCEAYLEEVEAEMKCKIEKIYGIDAASGAAVLALDISAGDHVLDLCAAPGAKLCMISDLLGDSGSVTGVDVASHRLAACRTMLQKYALGDRCRLFVGDGTTFSLVPVGFHSESKSCESALEEKVDAFREWTSRRPYKERKKATKARKTVASQLVLGSQHPELIFYGRHSGVVGVTRSELYQSGCDSEVSSQGYDKVLVDAECTHDGSIKHIQKFEHWGWTTLQRRVLDAERTDSLTTLQLKLLSNGFRLLKVGGSLVYSTCSLTVAQNEDVVQKFLKENASAELQEVNAAKNWPCKSGQIPNTLRFDPLTSETSGLFHHQNLSHSCTVNEIHQSRASPENPSDIENSPVEQVALTVPITDDSSLPSFTFRTWILGSLACVLLSFLNQFFCMVPQRASLANINLSSDRGGSVRPPHGLDDNRASCEFTLNPGPFNVKEHVLITIFANSGARSVYSIHLVSAVKLFYKKELTFMVALVVVITSQVMGFCWAVLFRRYLVDSAAICGGPKILSKFRSSVSWNQYILNCEFTGHYTRRRRGPSVLCLLCLSGLPIPNVDFVRDFMVLELVLWGLIGLAFPLILGALASPWFATANVAAGFALLTYVITPLADWLNIYKAKAFPIFSDGLFTSNGQSYNVSAIIDPNFRIDIEAYELKGPLYMSTFFAINYGVKFACIAATVVHVFLFHGSKIRQLSNSALQEKKMDVHTKLMRKYKQVPQWWFLCLLLVNIVATIFSFQYYNDQLQWWGILLACSLALFFTLRVGVITATTNQVCLCKANLECNHRVYHRGSGYPVANICFKVYGYISMKQGITFLQDFKLGHYMKIPPRAMFMAQVVGTIIAAFVHLRTAWWLMDTVPNICDRALLPAGSPWTCPGDHVFYDASVIWGLIGPRRIFGDLGYYFAINWFFLAGAIAPVLVWLAHKVSPDKHWIRLITMPVLLGATINMPPAPAVNYTSWILIGFASGFVAYRYYCDWWSRHNYVLSGAFDAGLAFMGVVLYLYLGMEHVSLNWWGSDWDGCPLGSCLTAQGVVVDGCLSIWFRFSIVFGVLFDLFLMILESSGTKLCMISDLLGDSDFVTGIDVARHHLAACRTMLQKFTLGD
ncbi:oligopeptide transporter 7 [Quercus suber]|uniref:Oligopeptide transporter 7 n=1 Tax=Quercus suber TaxID=58331 RepID=A0AAW0L3W1_QUESU